MGDWCGARHQPISLKYRVRERFRIAKTTESANGVLRKKKVVFLVTGKSVP
jgi:hypothetical protein